MNTLRLLRYSAVGFTALVLASAGTAMASAEEHGAEDIEVAVEIPQIEEPGVLALTVAANSSTLVEEGSTELERQFIGTLPTVTVTDTRAPEDVPAGAAWYVLGTASDFATAGQPATTIGAENLGWSPALVESEGDAFISVGDDVEPALEDGPGLVDQELLYLGESESANGGTWSASAGLLLKVGADVEPGAYTSKLTLSLFE